MTQDPSMTGFVRNYEGKTNNPQAAHRIMKCFSAEKLPVLTDWRSNFAFAIVDFLPCPAPRFPIAPSCTLPLPLAGWTWESTGVTFHHHLRTPRPEPSGLRHLLPRFHDGLDLRRPRRQPRCSSVPSTMIFFPPVPDNDLPPIASSSLVLRILPAAMASPPFPLATSIPITM